MKFNFGAQRILSLIRGVGRTQENQTFTDIDGRPGQYVTPQADQNGNQYVRLVAIEDAEGTGETFEIQGVQWQNDDADTATITGLATSSLLYGVTSDFPPDSQAKRIRLQSDFNAAQNIKEGVVLVTGPAQWQVNNAAAENAAATATRAAQGAGTRNIVQSATFSLQGSLASADGILARIRDGAGGPILWQAYIGISSTSGAHTIAISGLNLLCSDNTAAVAEFSAAGGADTFESVAMQGITV